MQAKIEQEGDVVVVHLGGLLNYEAVESFRAVCLKHLVQKKIVFDMQNLSFVGSIGITDLVAVMTEISQRPMTPVKFSRVSSEYLRVLQASELQSLEIYETPDYAKMAHQGFEAPMIRLDPVIDLDFLGPEGEGDSEAAMLQAVADN